MKRLLLALASLYSVPSLAATPDTYGLHLFFNEKEFVDVLTLTRDAGSLHGHMSVPRDFEADILGARETGSLLSFDLLVPRNASRPEDLLFHYEGSYFDATRKQLTGFVTIKGQPGFVASFVAFLREGN